GDRGLERRRPGRDVLLRDAEQRLDAGRGGLLRRGGDGRGARGRARGSGEADRDEEVRRVAAGLDGVRLGLVDGGLLGAVRLLVVRVAAARAAGVAGDVRGGAGRAARAAAALELLVLRRLRDHGAVLAVGDRVLRDLVRVDAGVHDDRRLAGAEQRVEVL